MARRTPPYAPVIRYLRERHGLSRSQLAHRLGVPEYYVGYLEEGYRHPREPQLRALSRIFQWSVFELALLADEPIPYPDWPARADVAGWLRLGSEWAAIVEDIQRYAVTRALFDHPDWVERLRAEDAALAQALDRFGLVALYGWVRERWTPLAVPAARLRPAASLAEALEAIAAAPAPPPRPAPQLPPWWEALTPDEQATVETVARGLVAARTAQPPES
jgi:transcriptional regulator with XRE-family HTH domain